MRLTNLRIREISSVDAGAGEEVKVAFWKKRDDRELSDPIAKGTDALYASVASIIGDDELEDKQAALAETFDQYNDYLEEHLAFDGSSSAEKRGRTEMDIITVAKRMAASGLPSACYTRQDFLDELNKRVLSERKAGETKEQAFLRLVTSDADGLALYRAHNMSPGHDQDRAAHVERPVAKSTPSLDKLRQLARLHHQEHPEVTAEMAFSKIYADPANRELVAAERRENRPNATVEKRGGTAPVGDRVAQLAASLARAHRDLSHNAAIAAILERNPTLAAAYRREQAEQAGRKD